MGYIKKQYEIELKNLLNERDKILKEKNKINIKENVQKLLSKLDFKINYLKDQIKFY